MTHSTHAEIPVPAGDSPEPPARSALSGELTEFLVELASSLQKRAMYPDGHPMLLATVDRLLVRLDALLEAEPALAIGVARQQLLLGGAATDPGSALCRELAARLHRHRIASLRIARGVTAEQLGELLARLAAEPARGLRPLGAELETLPAWGHITIQPTGYDRLALRRESGLEHEPNPGQPTGGELVWLDLARLSLQADPGGPAPDPADLDQVAEGLTRRIGSGVEGPQVLAHLTRLAESLHDLPDGLELRDRMSTLVTLLEPGALARLMGDAAAEGDRLAHAAAAALAPEAVVELVDAAARASHRTVSPHLLRLLRKLGHLARTGAALVRPQADAAVRKHVAKLLTDWHLEDPNPTQYTHALEKMAHVGGAGESEPADGWDPHAVLCTALEIGEPGAPAVAAAETLVQSGRLGEVVATLGRAPSAGTTEPIWAVIATPETLRTALGRGELESEAVRLLIDRLGAEAVEPLIELLAASEDHSVRAATVDALGRLGGPAAARAVELLPDAPWYLLRNLLILLGRTGNWPDGFSPASFAVHQDPRVRREAVRLWFESPEGRGEGLAHGLADSDPGIVAMALGIALESCPASLLPVVDRMARDSARRSVHRVLAIRVLVRSGGPLALESLASIVLPRRRWFLRRRLAPKSPELLAALTGLAAHWPDEPSAAEALSKAANHADLEIRAAARRPA